MVCMLSTFVFIFLYISQSTSLASFCLSLFSFFFSFFLIIVMDNARLRIKFTPLMQNFRRNDSKCCLEIIPEVTCVQNLDKIDWTPNNNLMEYVIPMTYKIILKKHHKQMENNEIKDKSEKTYHSCVDLLLTSSISSLDLGCGDITRLISDTLIFSKISEIAQSKTLTHTQELDRQAIKPNTSSIKVLEIEPKVTDESVSVMNTKHVCTSSCSIEEKDKNCQVPDNISASTDVESFTLLDKITNTESAILIHNFLNDTSIPTVTKESAKTIKSTIDETKRKLSLTPICSINTVDNIVNAITAVTSNTVISRLYDSQTKNMKIPTSISKAFNDNGVNSDLTCYLDLPKKFCCTNKTPSRILPEVRISMFMRLMKTEIMPLQIMLNDILRKCSSLGLQWDSNVLRARNSILFKNIPRCNNQSRQQQRPKSNRVVYSIVFDD